MSSSHTIELPARLGTGDVKALIDELRTTADQDLTIDAGKVTHLGTLCLQALIAGAKAHVANGTDLSFTNPGEVFLQQLALFGLSPELIQGGLE
ncbi:STAS domain-containing protein [Thalassobius sp. I31.1]|uniref:STAS domain-containing protein n=1 Tax=Thalassobius sp. I31.1 TaxID=2109912 RepID=UPI000D1A3D56|nr:STAS domain-containing protein [Thalassobius sp. I31.1]